MPSIKLCYYLLFMFCGVIDLSAQSIYYVILVKGQVETKEGRKLLKNDKFTDESLLKFGSAEDLVIAINSEGGKYILKQKKVDVNTENDFSYFVKDVILPVRAKASTRDFETDYLNFLRNNRFVYTDQLVLPDINNGIQLAYAIRGQGTKHFEREGALLVTPLEKNIRFLSIQRKENGEWHDLSRISLKYIKASELSKTLNAIKEGFEDQENLDLLLEGFLAENYGYLHPSEIERLL